MCIRDRSNAADLMKLLDEVLPYLSTDMTNSQIMLLAAKCIPITVSYTHLDVYKRQDMG